MRVAFFLGKLGFMKLKLALFADVRTGRDEDKAAAGWLARLMPWFTRGEKSRPVEITGYTPHTRFCGGKPMRFTGSRRDRDTLPAPRNLA